MAARVVVTGMGLLSPAGNSADAFWAALNTKAEPPREIDQFDTAPFRNKKAFMVPEFSLRDYVKEVSMNRMERFSKLVLAAGSMAIGDAGLTVGPENEHRIGSVITSVYGPVNVTVKYLRDLVVAGPSQVSPIYFQQTVMNVAGGQLSIQYRLKGVSSTLAGSSSLAYAFDLIRSGRADVVLAIGVEELCEQVYHAYSGSGLLSDDQSRPLAAGSAGLVLGEGCGVLVLESQEHAAGRGARVYGELLGWATLNDRLMNRHVGLLEEGPESALHQTMAQCLQDTVRPEQVGVVSCLANGSPAVDRAEGAAIRSLCGPDMQTVAVKAHIGETLGASEVFSMIAALLCLRSVQVPTASGPRTLAAPYALCNSLLVSGNVTSWLLRKGR